MQGNLEMWLQSGPGSCHDSFIFRSSALGRSLEEGVHDTEDGLLLGDSGYALRSYLMTHTLYRPCSTLAKKI